MSHLSYEKFETAIPELKHKKFEVVIIGYEMCPFSIMANNSLARVPHAKGKSVFVMIERGEKALEFRKETGYHGSFPIVFVRHGDKMVHVGGGQDFASYVNKKYGPSKMEDETDFL